MESDLELLNAARRMDKEALVKIFDLYASALYRYALRLCGDPVRADHMVGDVFERLLEQLAEGHGPRANLRSYLYQTIYHRIIDEARTSWHSAPLEAAACLRQDRHSTALSLEDQILFKQIQDAIRSELTDDQRHVIVLRFMEDFSIRETAAIMGKTLENVKVIQNRALAKLRKSLDEKAAEKSLPSPQRRALSQVFSV